MGTWACALPDCTHFMPRNVENMVEGKKSICWKCNQIIILDASNMRDDRPICRTCKFGNQLDVTL